jgi:hypothetical protein
MTYNGAEITSPGFMILKASEFVGDWVTTSNITAPQNSFIGKKYEVEIFSFLIENIAAGWKFENDVIFDQFICRGMSNDVLFIGRFDSDPTHGKCYISDGGVEVGLTTSEVLVKYVT